MLKIIFIRHGKTLGNELKKYVGCTDENLLESSREYLKQRYYPPVEQVFSSPMLRAQETAKIIYPLQKPVIIDDFRECNFGIFEYKSYEELKNDFYYQRWLAQNGEGKIPCGENASVFRARTCAAFCRILRENIRLKQWHSAAMVIHGGSIMAIMAAFSQAHDFYYWQVANGEGFIVFVDENSWENNRRFSKIEKLWSDV